MNNKNDELFAHLTLLALWILGMAVLGIRSAQLLPKPIKTPNERIPISLVIPKQLSIYELASRITGCPEWVLAGIDFAESSCGANLDHPNTQDKGRFGLNERFHRERAEKWGEFDPNVPLQAAIIAGYLYMENLRLLGNSDDAICAHLQGPTGVRLRGRNLAYLERVRNPILV